MAGVRCALVALAAAALALVAPGAFIQADSSSAGPDRELFVGVSGNHLVDGAGNRLRLLGVNRSGSEYSCVKSQGIFDGPADAASVAAMTSWHVNAVRVPLNEDCWLGINGVPAAYGGAAYRQAIADYVSLLHRNHLYVVLDLHLTAPGSHLANKTQVMPDADHSIAFWRDVAQTFREDRGMLFDLFSAPRDVGWDCWLAGVSCGGTRWPVAGMQTLVLAIRSTGAPQPVIVGGLGDGADDLQEWLAHRPSDPDNALVAGVHVFSGSKCDFEACWDDMLGAVARKVPVVTTEAGSNGCGGQLVNSYTSWADEHEVSYLAWAWTTWSNCHALVSQYNGTPANDFGRAYRTHLQALFSGVLPAPRRHSRAAALGLPTLAPGQFVSFLLGAIAVLSVLAMGVSLTLTAVILRERRGPVRAVAGAAPDERDEAGDVQDVEFYGPAPAGSDPDEDDDAQAPATGEGRQRRSLVKRPS